MKRRRKCSSDFVYAEDDPLAPTPIAKFARRTEPPDSRMDTTSVPSVWEAPNIDYSSPPRRGPSPNQEMPMNSKDYPLPPTPTARFGLATEPAVPTIEHPSPHGRVTSPHQDSPLSSCCYDADTEDQWENWVTCEDLESLQGTVMQSLAETDCQRTTIITSPTGADRRPSLTWFEGNMDSSTTESDREVLELLEDMTAPCSAAGMQSPRDLMTDNDTRGWTSSAYPPRTTSIGHPTKSVGGILEMNKAHSITVNPIGSQHQHRPPLSYRTKREMCTTLLPQASPQSNFKRLGRQGHKSDSTIMDVLMNSPESDRPM